MFNKLILSTFESKLKKLDPDPSNFFNFDSNVDNINLLNINNSFDSINSSLNSFDRLDSKNSDSVDSESIVCDIGKEHRNIDFDIYSNKND
jgi:hypothetical protein